MRLLLDSSMWGPTGAVLRAAGHDVNYVGEWPSDPGDRAILARAYDESRVLVTVDNDFGELAVRLGAPHAGIIRLALTPAPMKAAVVLDVITAYESELLAGAIVTATPTRVRIRMARRPDDP